LRLAHANAADRQEHGGREGGEILLVHVTPWLL
jgi:hypothetical protein